MNALPHRAEVGRRTIHVGLVVSDLDRSLAFYLALGYRIVGEVPDSPIGHLTMLKLPGDEFVSLELVSEASTGGSLGLSHLVVTVDSLGDAARVLHSDGLIDQAHVESTDPESPQTLVVVDPDGNRIELVQWPAGHPDGLTSADWPDS